MSGYQNERIESLNTQWLAAARNELPEGADRKRVLKDFFHKLHDYAEETLFHVERTKHSQPTSAFAWGLVIRLGHATPNFPMELTRMVGYINRLLDTLPIPPASAHYMAENMMDPIMGLGMRPQGVVLLDRILKEAFKNEDLAQREVLARKVLSYASNAQSPVAQKQFGRVRHAMLSAAQTTLGMPVTPYQGVSIRPAKQTPYIKPKTA